MSLETRLILNERILGFPYGQCAPATVLEAAFELGKKSALVGVEANPFMYDGAARRIPVHHPSEMDPYRGAEAVAWLRGHYLASKAMMFRDAA